MDKNISVSIENISKIYKLYASSANRVKEIFHPFKKKYFEPFVALNDISFNISKGESIGIIGRNGSGKSTLLQIISGVLQPTSGSISIKGRVSALLELGTGFNPDFTGRENVYLNASILGLSKEQIDDRFDNILAFADIGGFIDQPVKTYSSGMMIRLAFSVLAHVETEILIVDEALAVGDVFFVQKCMRWIRNFQEQGTLIFVTHDIGALTGLCERAIWLHQGKIVKKGISKSVSEAYLEAFIEEREKETTTEAIANAQPPDPIGTNKKNEKDDPERLCQKRNGDITLSDPGKGHFGKGNAMVIDAKLHDCITKQVISHISGGEFLRLFVKCRSEIDCLRPIIGFYCKNYLGQELFGDNTFVTYKDNDFSVNAGETFYASFKFQMPILPSGDYSVAIGLADGDQEEHVICHWLHDALVFKSINQQSHHGLVGIPVTDVILNTC